MPWAFAPTGGSGRRAGRSFTIQEHHARRLHKSRDEHAREGVDVAEELAGSVSEGVRLTNPDRILYPGQGISKRRLALYYETVASRMLPHVADRPLMLVRCPTGHGGKCFHQKHARRKRSRGTWR